MATARFIACSILHALRVGGVLACGMLSGCSGGGGDPPSSADSRAVSQSDRQIAELLYADTQRTPTGFYQDSAPPVQGYTATMHIKNTDLPGAFASPQHELCTDDWNTALSWSDEAATGPLTSTLVATDTTDHYYEFGRLHDGTPQLYIRARVYRCSYLDRSDVDLQSDGAAAGQLNERPLNADELKQLSEYLWQFTPYNNYGNVVLKSSGESVAGGWAHTLIIATLTASTAANGCDRIDVIDWRHRVDSQTGMLTRDTIPLWEFGARRNAGVVELCAPN